LDALLTRISKRLENAWCKSGIWDFFKPIALYWMDIISTIRYFLDATAIEHLDLLGWFLTIRMLSNTNRNCLMLGEYTLTTRIN